MRSVISVDDGGDGCLACTGLELPKDKMLRIATHGGILKDSKGEKFDKTQYVFRAEGKSVVKARNRARGIKTRFVARENSEYNPGAIVEPEVDQNLKALCEEAKSNIQDPKKLPATEVTMANVKEMRTSLASMLSSGGQ